MNKRIRKKAKKQRDARLRKAIDSLNSGCLKFGAAYAWLAWRVMAGDAGGKSVS